MIMKKPNITKGEWEIVETKNGNLLIVADNLIVCRINELAELTDPNAKAISAVPDMIDALMNVYSALQLIKEDGYDYADEDKIKEALEKAGVQL